MSRTQGYPDGEITDQLINLGIFTILAPEEKFTQILKDLHRDLHMGEMEILALADEIHGIAIIQDRIDREIGEMFRVEVRGSAFFWHHVDYRTGIKWIHHLFS